MDARVRLVDGLSRAMGLAAGAPDQRGTSVVGDEEKRGTGLASCYQLGRHAVVWCDPDVVDALAWLGSERTLSDHAWRAHAVVHRWAVVGRAVMKTLHGPVHDPDRPPGSVVHAIDVTRADDVAMIERFVARVGDDDLDDAELSLDELDEIAVALLDEEGEIAAYSSAREWDVGELAGQEHRVFGDIGVVTRPEVRRRGWGRGVVAELIDHRLPASWEPLYRCDPENAGSDRLSRGLGFEVDVSLTAVRLRDRAGGSSDGGSDRPCSAPPPPTSPRSP